MKSLHAYILLLLTMVYSLDSWKYLRGLTNRLFSMSASTKRESDSDNDQSNQRTPFTLAKVISNNFEAFQKSNPICFSGPSSQQFLLKFNSPPKRIFLIVKPEENIYAAMRQAIHYLCKKDLIVYLDAISYDYLMLEHRNEFSKYLSNTTTMNPFTPELINFENNPNTPLKICTNKIKRVDDKSLNLIDVIISFGGDGLLMHCNTLFEASRQSIPPIMSFDFGSMGFLAPFSFDEFETEINNMLTNAITITLRMRLQCTVLKNDTIEGVYHVLNEAVVDRGPSPYLSAIEVECDNQYLTTVQGDGVIIATPTGSTAYSLAAGGSMVHPSVPAILLTPICAHTLSFRPILIPDSSFLTCTVPHDSRSSAWVSFDGKFRQELNKGDRVIVRMSPIPLPTINRKNFTADWFDALRSGFMFNERPKQKPFQAATSKIIKLNNNYNDSASQFQ